MRQGSPWGLIASSSSMVPASRLMDAALVREAGVGRNAVHSNHRLDDPI